MAFGLPYEEHCNAIEEYRSRNAIRAARRSPRQRFRGLRRGHFVLALGVGTLPDRAGFEPLLHQVGAAAVGALLCDRLPPRAPLAVRLPDAPVEGVTLPGTA